MESKAEELIVEQTGQRMLGALRQLMLPMIAGLSTTKNELLNWVHQMGLAALKEIFSAEAERVVGQKGKQQSSRAANHWGSTHSEFPFGGRRLRVARPRVRSSAGREQRLKLVEHFKQVDPIPERVVNQILLGVSTRSYEKSLEAPPAGATTRGSSKSAASRQFICRTAKKMAEYLKRPLEGLSLLALMLDAIQIGGHAVVVALGIDSNGEKHPLGLWLGSTENAKVCTDLLQDLISRGLKLERRILCVIDGGKGLHRALTDVFGDAALIQRCQLHKKRNVLDYLPEARKAYVSQALSEAYHSATAETARKKLRALMSWLEHSGEQSAANSLGEGMEETLTVLKLKLSKDLTRSLATTNAIENLMGSVRKIARNVKRWRDEAMVKRWTALAIADAQERFRKIKGFRALPRLAQALTRTELDPKQKAA
jgi:transposase-like protein